MIVADINPFSTHLVVMAAEEMIEKIVQEKSATLTLDLEQQMTERGLQVWRDHKRDAYNFLKHGRRPYRPDKPAPDALKLMNLNDLMSVYNVLAYRDLTGDLPDYMATFYTAVALMNEGMIEWSADMQVVRDRIGEVSRGEMRLMVGKALYGQA